MADSSPVPYFRMMDGMGWAVFWILWSALFGGYAATGFIHYMKTLPAEPLSACLWATFYALATAVHVACLAYWFRWLLQHRGERRL